MIFLKTTIDKRIVAAVIIVLLFIIVCYSEGLKVSDDDDDVVEIISNGFGSIIATLIPTEDTDDADDYTPPEGEGHWEEAGTVSEWNFVGSGDFSEWELSFGDYSLGSHKVEISRRWNFKDVFECGEGSVVWCLHDSNDNRIWHREDTSTIMSYVTDTITSGTYDGTPWVFFVGNNYVCDIDPHWIITIYSWVE